MSTYIAFIFNKDATKAVDNSTVILKVNGGTCTLRFVNKDHMKEAALTMLAAADKPEDESLEPVNLLEAIEKFDVAEEEEEEVEETKVEEPAEVEESEEGSVVDSVAESIDALPDTPDPRNNDNASSGSESSFEDYAGMGLTQELNF